MIFDTLVVRNEGSVLFAAIQAPPMNLIGPQMVRDLISLIQQAETDGAVQVTGLDSYLTRDQLRAIWQRAPSPAVRLLLWEIHRLRGLVLRANDFVRQAMHRGAQTGMDSTSSALLDGLRESLKDEPVVREDEARRL
jgi:hypothetical protein